MTTPAPVAVGYDGSDNSGEAVGYAAVEARLHDRPLLVVHVMPEPQFGFTGDMVTHWEGAGRPGRDPAAQLRARAADCVRRWAPDQPVDFSFIEATTVSGELVDRSRDWASLVMGSRGHGGFAGLMLGSTSWTVAAHAHCPVVVVRPSPDRAGPGPVVVGVEGAEQGSAVLRFAFETASLRALPLTAVYAWRHPVSEGPGDMLPLVYDEQALEQEAEAMLSEAVAGWRDKYSDVDVTLRAVRGRPRQVLLEAGRDAELVVVGSRGHGGFAGMLLGSTSQALLHHAETSVAVVHGD